MNYIGSKFSLLSEIRWMLQEQGTEGGTFCDLFSGTTVVAQMARQDGFTVIANDLQAYSYAMQMTFLGTKSYPQFGELHLNVPGLLEEQDPVQTRASFGLGPEPGIEALSLRRVLHHLEKLPPREGRFFHAYCEGGDAGRNYFARESGARCEAIRDQIEAWKRAGWLDEVEYQVLLACLIETMDLLANTASVYGAFLKQVKKSARNLLVLRIPRLLKGNPGAHRAFMQDGLTLVHELAQEGRHGVLYLDPPYNHRQYHANYHLLETIARWDLDSFEPAGKTGLRPGAGLKSDFCSRRHVAKAFREIIQAANFAHILVSYNDEGLLPESELCAMLAEKAGGRDNCEFYTLNYKRFRADQDGESRRYKGDSVREFLFYARTLPAPVRS
jgi:adenine-specific DNA-methyltransferase